MTKIKGQCDRCNEETNLTKMSFFNTDICCRKCIQKEKKHELYTKAVEEEVRQSKKGNFNFKGIGLPKDLR